MQASNSTFNSYEEIGASEDSDGDGMPDVWEVHHFGAITYSAGGPHEDFDQDGLCDLYEYVAGTTPTNPESMFMLVGSYTNANFVVRFTTLEPTGLGYQGKQRFYDLKASSNLLDGLWQPIPGRTNIPGNGGIVVYTNEGAAGIRFFRGTTRLAP